MGNLNTNAVIDAVDDNDRVIGEQNRRDIASTKANFRTVHLFGFNDDGSLLVQYIAPGHRSDGKWGSTVAGYVLAGETYEAACKRKIADELRISLPTIRLIGKTSMTDLGVTKFITLYAGILNSVPDFDRQQISRMQFFPSTHIQDTLENHPEMFTDTFRLLYEYYCEKQGESRLSG